MRSPNFPLGPHDVVRCDARAAGRHVLRALAIPLVLGACRADSTTMPMLEQADSVCYDSACTPADALPLSAPIVIEPLDDAATRIVPNMMDSKARDALLPTLNALRQALLAGRQTDARVQLAMAYDLVDAASGRLTASADASVVLDLADLSAVRLSLVPASRALGVAVR